MKKTSIILAIIMAFLGTLSSLGVSKEVQAYDINLIDDSRFVYNTNGVYFNYSTMNNDGYIYAYTYENSISMSANTYPVLYDTDRATPLTSFSGFATEVNKDLGMLAYVYRLKVLDQSKFAMKNYYGIRTTFAYAKINGGVTPWYGDPEGFSSAEIEKTEDIFKEYEIPGTPTNPFMNGGGTTDPNAPDPNVPTDGYRYRFYNPATGDHVFLATKLEGFNAGYLDDKVTVKVAKSGDKVYQLYNSRTKDHIYTTDKAYGEFVVKQGIGYAFDYNGNAAFFSGGKTPVYSCCVEGRPQHLYTASKNEAKIAGYTVELNGGTPGNPKPVMYFQ